MTLKCGPHVQGNAEAVLEQLHGESEIKLSRLVHGCPDVVEFAEFRKRLIGMTDVTRTFFDKLIKQLEVGFATLSEDYMGQVSGGLGLAKCGS